MDSLLNPEEFHSQTPADQTAIAQMRTTMGQFLAMPSGALLRVPFNAFMAQTPLAAGITFEQATVGGVPGYWCRPAENRAPTSAVLYLHGGAFVAGSAESYRGLASQLASRVGVDFFVVDYRLAPEHPFPAAVQDVQAAYQGLVDLGRQHLGIAGDSAGGGLTLTALANLTHAGATDPAARRPRVGLALSPWADLTQASASMRTQTEVDFIVNPDWLSRNAADYLQGHAAHDPQASPLFGNPAGLPPLQLHVGNDEVLRDDAIRYADRARAAGVATDLHVWEGMPHVFLSNVGTLEAATRALDIASAFLRGQLV
jgi:monoterpene epsilon-lactone hydrolase